LRDNKNIKNLASQRRTKRQHIEKDDASGGRGGAKKVEDEVRAQEGKEMVTETGGNAASSIATGFALTLMIKI